MSKKFTRSGHIMEDFIPEIQAKNSDFITKINKKSTKNGKNQQIIGGFFCQKLLDENYKGLKYNAIMVLLY